jgi:hypothetical protein
MFLDHLLVVASALLRSSCPDVATHFDIQFVLGSLSAGLVELLSIQLQKLDVETVFIIFPIVSL